MCTFDIILYKYYLSFFFIIIYWNLRVFCVCVFCLFVPDIFDCACHIRIKKTPLWVWQIWIWFSLIYYSWYHVKHARLSFTVRWWAWNVAFEAKGITGARNLNGHLNYHSSLMVLKRRRYSNRQFFLLKLQMRRRLTILARYIDAAHSCAPTTVVDVCMWSMSNSSRAGHGVQ